jgi:outer membrane protein assembly factor BamB
MYGDHIFQLGDDATLRAINKHNGHIFWTRRIGVLSASTPAVVGHTVYATALASGGGGSPGRVVALDYAHGSILWSRGLPSPSESSPMVDHGMLFFGSQSGIVYALNATNGSVIWTYHASGAVKASPTLKGGALYFGDYPGTSRRSASRPTAHMGGRLSARCSAAGPLLHAGGRLWSSFRQHRWADIRVDAQSGKLDWAVQTGAYVYASPAVTDAPGLGPTIYLGSYDGNFYALNARSGQISWRFGAGGRISGSATIIGRTVYFADLGDHRTYGLGISTGRVLFEKDTGAFDPVISDGERIYLTGSTGLYALAPK